MIEYRNCAVARAPLVCRVRRGQNGIVDQCCGHRAGSYLNLKVHARLCSALHVETRNAYSVQCACSAAHVCKSQQCNDILAVARLGLN